MKAPIFLLAFLLLNLVSCKSSKADDFKQTIIQKERIAYDILLDKEGTESQKLEFLIKDDYKTALVLVDKQAKEFDELINDIKVLNTNGISEAEQLKIAAVKYYSALRDLHYFDRREIEQQQIIFQLKGKESQLESKKLINLARQKKELYQEVYKQESELHDATIKFDSVNRL